MIKEFLSLVLKTDSSIFFLAAAIAALIYIVAYLLIVRYVMTSINKKIIDAPEIDEVKNKYAIYFICILFWPAAIILGNNYLAKPETAKTGRLCIIIFLWFTAFILTLAFSSVVFTYIYLPEIIEFFKAHGFW